MSGFSWRLLSEPMEARILHSADISPLTWAGPSALQVDSAQVESTQTTAHVNEIVFVDATLPDGEDLLADLRAQRDAGRALEIVRIEAGTDGLALIGRTLETAHDITAVHVLAHGSDGRMQLGSAVLDAQTLLQRADELAAWGNSMTGDADLLLYGCDLAQGADGQRLVQDLAALTGADVAASTDLTGAAARGGNWTLEFGAGHIEAALAPSNWAQARWQGVMATYTVTTTADGAGAGTLRWAINQANANAGNDTIVFGVNGSFNIAASSTGDDNNNAGDFDVRDSVSIVGNGSGSTVINGNGLDRVFDLRSGTVSLSDLTIQGGASNSGAGIRINSAVMATLTDVVIQNNIGNGGSKGAGIFNDGSLTLRRVIVQNNGNTTSGDTDGAGIYNDNGASLDARDVEIRGNVAAGNKDGGGLYIGDNGSVVLQNVTLADNVANRGGGVWNHADGTTLVNVTIAGNTGTKEGGGLWADRTVALDHVSVVANSSATGAGGGVHGNATAVSVRNSLFAGNAGGNTSQALNSQGYNLSDDNSAGFLGTGDRRNVGAGVLSLAANGGFTRTVAITAASAARDAADPVSTLAADQRGIPSYNGRADIGAYEYNPYGAAPTISAVSNQSIAEDQTLAPVSFTIGDFETSPASLLLSATSSNPALVANAAIVFGGSGANRTISLTPIANANSTGNGGPTTITITVSDGGNTASSSFVVTVSPLNDAPSVALPSAQSVDEDGVLVLNGGNAPQITDVDAGSASVQVTLAVANGTLTLSQTTGLAFVTGTGSSNASMTFVGSLAAVNTALTGLQYRPGANFNGTDRLDLSINDLGNSGGAARSANGSLDITVNPRNDAPLLGLPGPQTTPQPTPLSFSAASGNAITVSDVDAGGGALQITLNVVNGTITFGSTSGLTLVEGTGTADGRVVLTGSTGNLNAALGTLSFTGASAGPARIDLALDDLGNSGAGVVAPTTGSVTITVGNDALPLMTLSRATATFIEGGGSVLLDSALTLSDADNPTLASARVAIGTGYDAADVLGFVNDGSTMGNIGGSYSAGVLSLSSAGQTASLAEWEAALRAVTYTNASESPSTATRTLTLTVNDGIADSAERQITMGVFAVNDAPVLSGANALAPIAEDAVTNGGTLVATLIAGFVTDADSAASSGIAVVAVDNSQGLWQYTVDGGTNWLAFGSVSDGAARLLTADSNTSVRFVPASNWNGTLAGGISFRAWDQTDPGVSGVADTTSNGASTAFSSATFSASIVVSPVNDAPVLSGANALAPIAEDAVTNGGTLVATLIAGFVTDADSAASSGIAVVAVDNSQGLWQYTVDGGTNWLAFGSVSDGAARLLTADSNTSVRFVPASNWNGTLAGGISFRAWDQTDPGVSGVADTTSNGASTAFSSATFSASIVVTPVNDAPVLSGANALAPIAEDAVTNGGTLVATLIAGFVTDADSAASSGIAVVAVDNSQGLWQYTVDGGTNWLAFGSVSDGAARLLTADSNTSVRFVPASNWNGTLAGGISFRAWDQTDPGVSGVADTTSNGASTAFSSATFSASIVVSPVNDAPVLSGANALAPIAEDAVTNGGTLVATLIAGFVTDADSAASSGIAVVAVDNSQGLWQYTVDGGTNWLAFGSVSDGAARLLTADSNTSVRFVPASNWNGTLAGGISFRAWDQTDPGVSGVADTTSNGASTAFSSATFSASIVVTPVNDAPVLSGANALAPIAEDAVTNGGTLVATLIAGFVTDADSAASSGIAVVAVDNSQGLWQYTVDGGTNWLAFGSVSDGAARLLTADSNTSVRFVPASNWNGTLAGGISFRAWDQTDPGVSGVADTTSNGASTAFSSATFSASIVVTPVNDAPVLSGANALAPIAEDAVTNGGTLVATLIAGFVTDADSAASSGIAVVAVDNSQGLWQYTVDGGTNWLAFGSVSDGAARLLTADSNTSVRFVPASNWNGTLAGGISFRAWDQTDPGVSGVADTTSNGASTAFSSATFSASIVVTPVNDAPVLSGANALAPIAEDAVTNGGTLVATLIAGFVTDADSAASSGIAVVAVDNSQGLWQYTVDGGTNWLAFGSVSDGAARLLTADSNTSVRFVPASNWNGTLAGGISFRAWDQTDPGVSGVADTTSNGASTAFSSATFSASIVVSPVNDAASGSVTIAGTAIQGQTLTATHTLADADGPTTLLISYQWYADGTEIGGATAGTLLLDQGLVGKAISVVARYTDALGVDASVASTATAAVANLNNAPVLAQPVADQTTRPGEALQFALPATTFADPDTGDVLSFRATLADGSPLPGWIQFNTANQLFTVTNSIQGTPGPVLVRVVASDPSGASAQVLFAFIVVPAPSEPPAPADVITPAPAVSPPAQAPNPAPQPFLVQLARSPAAVVPPSEPPAETPEPAQTVATPSSAAQDANRTVEPDAEQETVTSNVGSRQDKPSSAPPSVRSASRADSVLASALITQYTDLAVSPMLQLLGSDDLMRKFDELQRQLSEAADEHRSVVASSVVMTTGLSIGYVVWLVRGGVLVSSMLSALPAWQMIDPLPVLAAGGALKRRREAEASDEPEVDRLFNEPAQRVEHAVSTAPQSIAPGAPADAAHLETQSTKLQP